MKKAAWLFAVCGVCVTMVLAGCLKKEGGRTSSDYEQEIAQLQKQIETLTMEKEAEINRLTAENTKLVQEKQNSMAELEPVKTAVSQALQKEMTDGKVKVAMTDRGLVITMLGEILFEPGKDVLKPEGDAAVKKVGEIISSQAAGSDVLVEGNTDNDPIKFSGWKSNWELSSARALSVVHAITGKNGVKSEKIGFGGYGEYRPVASNSTLEGKKQNRRVDIVVVPVSMSKAKPVVEAAPAAAPAPAATTATAATAQTQAAPAAAATTEQPAKEAEPQGE
ncbi:MAG TPA: flagellar motor protein MotB [Candidatus Omnitrophota bacterium]|nr:flagellar motor protein MotB [Candidatus Omnitrophota bacterium]HPS21117.1 flagellar motor protein MotB [Candidatus Omnitrophota bacterium]